MKPGPRGAHASLAIGTRVLVFGGADRSPLAYNDLWQLETGTSMGFRSNGTDPMRSRCLNVSSLSSEFRYACTALIHISPYYQLLSVHIMCAILSVSS